MFLAAAFLCTLILIRCLLRVQTTYDSKSTTSATETVFKEFNDKHFYDSRKSRIVITVFDAMRWDWLRLYPEDTMTIEDAGGIPRTSMHNQMLFVHNMTEQLPEHTRIMPALCELPTMTAQRVRTITSGAIPDFLEAWNFSPTRASGVATDNILAQWNGIQSKKIIFLGDSEWVKQHEAYPTRQVFQQRVVAQSLADNFPDRADDVVSEFLWRYLELASLDPSGKSNYCFNELNSEYCPKPPYGDHVIIDRHFTPPNMDITGDWDVLINHWLGLDCIGHAFKFQGDNGRRRLVLYDAVVSNVLHIMTDRKIGMDYFSRHLRDADPITTQLPVFHEEYNNLTQERSEVFSDDTFGGAQSSQLPPPYLLFLGDHGTTDNGSHGGLSLSEIQAGLLVYSHYKLNSLSDFPEEWLKSQISDEQIVSPISVRQLDLPATFSALTGSNIPSVSLGVPAPHLLPFWPFTTNSTHLENSANKIANLRFLAHWHIQAAEVILAGIDWIPANIDRGRFSAYLKAKNNLGGSWFDEAALAIKDGKRDLNLTEYLAERSISDLEMEQYKARLIDIISEIRNVAREVAAAQIAVRSTLMRPYTAVIFGLLPITLLAAMWYNRSVMDAQILNCSFVQIVYVGVTCALVAADANIYYFCALLAAYLIHCVVGPAHVSYVRLIGLSNDSKLRWLARCGLLLLYTLPQESHNLSITYYPLTIAVYTCLHVAGICLLETLAQKSRAGSILRYGLAIGSLIIAMRLAGGTEVYTLFTDPITLSSEQMLMRCSIIVICIMSWQFWTRRFELSYMSMVANGLHVLMAYLTILKANLDITAATTDSFATYEGFHWISKLVPFTDIDVLQARNFGAQLQLMVVRFALVTFCILCATELWCAYTAWLRTPKSKFPFKAHFRLVILWIPLFLRGLSTAAPIYFLLIAPKLLTRMLMSRNPESSGDRQAILFLFGLNAFLASGLLLSIQALPFEASLIGLQNFHMIISPALLLVTCAWPFMYTFGLAHFSWAYLFQAFLCLIYADQYQVLRQTRSDTLSVISLRHVANKAMYDLVLFLAICLEGFVCNVPSWLTTHRIGSPLSSKVRSSKVAA